MKAQKISKAVVLLSGGMDSSTLLHYAKQRLHIKEIHALSFNYGQRHSVELEMAAWQALAADVRTHRIADIRVLSDLLEGSSVLTNRKAVVPELTSLTEKQRRQPPTYVPNRNMILLSLAAAYAEAHDIADVFYAAQAQDDYGYWDCTRSFLKRLNHVLSLNRGKPVTIRAPFIGMKKADVLKIGMALSVDYAHTWSCYAGKARPCGKCPSCTDRAKAFRHLGLSDPAMPA